MAAGAGQEGQDDAGRRKRHPVARWRAAWTACRWRSGRMVPGLLGANGADKSTLLGALAAELRAAASALRPGRGRICPAWRPRGWRRRAVLPAETGAGLRPGRGRGGGDGRLPFPELPPAAVEALVDRTLALADATHLRARRYPELSGGEQQRVQFARVLTQCLAARRGRGALPAAGRADRQPGSQASGRVAARGGGPARDERVGVRDPARHEPAPGATALLLGGGRAIASGPPSQVLTPASLHLAYGIAARWCRIRWRRAGAGADRLRGGGAVPFQPRRR